jgi:hypothetical protein
MNPSRDDPTALDALLRQEGRRQRLGDDAKCDLCHRAPEAALRQRRITVCAECAARMDHRSPIEDHHPLGRHLSSETVRSPTNLHAGQSERQRAWPRVLSTENDPLILLAAALRAIGDFCAWVTHHAEEWSDFLLRLRDALITRFGAAWQAELNLWL